MNQLNLTQTYKKDETLPWRRFGDNAIIINKDPEIVHIANDLAIRIWELLDGQSSLQQIGDIIEQEYESERCQINQDLFEFVLDLQGQKLIELV